MREATARAAVAVADVLIPADADVGGLDAGVGRYIVARLASGEESWLTERALERLDAEAGARFAGAPLCELSPQDRATVISELEFGRTRVEWPPGIDPARFVASLIALAHEGFYSDPANGGNDGAASWRMLGYSSGVPRRP